MSAAAGPTVLTVVVNGEAVLRYDRRLALPPQQLAYLDAMDRRMERGVPLDQSLVADPDPLQRARFVALQLWNAMRSEDEAPIAAACAWLANRIPELRQVRFELQPQGPHIDLVFDRDYVKEVRVDLIRPGRS